MADDIYAVVNFFLLYSQIFGLSPVILRRKDGKSFFKPFWLMILYTLVLAAVLCYSFQFSYGNIEMFSDNDFDIMFMHTVCKLVFGPICNAIIFSSSALSARNLCNVINKLSEYDGVFQKHVATMRYRSIKYIFLFVFLCSLCLASAYFYSEDVVLRKVSERNLSIFEFTSFFMSWCLFDVISWTLILNVFSFLYLVYKKFFQINQKLIIILGDYVAMEAEASGNKERLFTLAVEPAGSLTSSRAVTPHPVTYVDMRISASNEVSQIRHLHILLVKIAQDLNDIFATRIFTITSLNVVLLCFSSFLLILMLVLGRRDSTLITSVIWVCVRFFPICIMVIPFVLVTNEADRTSSLVHLVLSSVEDPGMRKELELFSMQLTNRKLFFTAHGLFTLDGKIVISVIGAAFAYLVVLLQFHITMSQVKQASNSTRS